MKKRAKSGRIPNFRKMYPEASDEIIEILKRSERKMQYQEFDLKREHTMIDQETQTVWIIPSQEDSYERLLELSVSFAADQPSTEDIAIQNILLKQLEDALHLLAPDEMDLIEQLYFREYSEREVAENYEVSQNTIHRRKHQILRKLKREIEKL